MFINERYIATDKKYSIVVAHPDDEILWASSILLNAEKVIICFSDSEDNEKKSEGRKNIQKNYPLKNTIFLNISEAKKSKKKVVYEKTYESKYGIEGFKDNVTYQKNYHILFDKLSKLLNYNETIFTHSPWGEYGHVEHIQINKILNDLSIEYKFELFYFGYFNSITYKYMLNKLPKKVKVEKYKINLNIFYQIRELYIKNNCWTWNIFYELPKYDFFLSFKNKKGLKIEAVTLNYLKSVLNIYNLKYFLKKKILAKSIKLRNDLKTYFIIMNLFEIFTLKISKLKKLIK